MTTNTMTVEQALKELREMFPDRASSIEQHLRAGVNSFREIGFYEQRVDVYVGSMPRGSGESLSDAMTQVRLWKENASE